MSLKPKEINFSETWNDLQKTVYGVITLSNVPRPVWNDRFLFVIVFLFTLITIVEIRTIRFAFVL